MFTTWDYVVLAVVLVLSASVGVYYRITGGKQKTTREYLLADRSMSILPSAFSLMSSFMSAITLLGLSMENYQFGTMFVLINISYVISTPFVAYCIVPVFYYLKSASVYEYLEKRFGFATRCFASAAFSCQMILYMGIVLYAPAIALEAVSGINRHIAIVIIGFVCTFYSVIGGLKAVIVTDVFQSLLMFASIFCVIIVAAIKAGGLGPIWKVAQEDGRIEFTNISVDPTTRHTWWTQIIGGMFTYVSLYGINQTQVQRILAVRNIKDAQKSLWWNLPILMTLSFSTSFSGLAMYYYYRNCDPLLEGRIASRDQLLPLFVVDTMGNYPGLAGLFVSGIFAASLSTISSAICSLAAVTLEDYLKPIYLQMFKKPIPEERTTLASKLISCVFGIICIGLAFAAGSLGGVLQAALTIFGVVGGPLLGVFMLGMLTKRANQKGVLIGLAVGLAISFWIGFGGPKPAPPILPMSTEGCPNRSNPLLQWQFAAEPEEQHFFWLYRLSYMWYSVVGFLVTFTIGYVSSVVFRLTKLDDGMYIYLDDKGDVLNTDLFIPQLAKIYGKKQKKDCNTKANHSSSENTLEEEDNSSLK